jgi:radical SAM protein with 4Fe4S-binding SPASM domain
VTSESVPHLESIARWFCEKFHPIVVNFEPMTESPESRQAGLAPPSPHDFARHALRSWQVLRSHNCEPASAAVFTDGLQNTSCPVGRDAVIVHPDGLLASCYLLPNDWEARGMDLTIGRILADGTVDIRMPDVLGLRRLIQSKPRCARCFCRLTCAGGCHVNHSYPGCAERYSDSCLAIRALTAATLLEDLGQSDVANDLVEDPEALDRLSARSSDRVLDIEEWS